MPKRKAPKTTTETAVLETPPVAPPPAKPLSKTQILIDLLRRPGGADIPAMMQATGWQAHSVRGALSGALKKGLGLPVSSQKTETGRVYSLPALAPAGQAADEAQS